jgi:nitrous oxidase accessory protein NosD
MFLSSSKQSRNSQSKSKVSRQAKCSAFQVESLEDRTVPSHVLTVGAGHQYATISSALAAAPANATIDVYPGTYNEAVAISKNGIQLVAVHPGVIVQPTTVTPVTLSGVNVGGAAIDIYADNVVVNGFTVDGSKDSDANLWAGIRVIEGGSATIKNNTVEGMLYGSPNTDVGIQIGTSLVSGGQGSGYANVYNNTVDDYAGAGMLVDGSGGTANIEGNTITGLGTANDGIVEYGVQVSNGASAWIQSNTIGGNTLQGMVSGGYNPSPASAGIFFYNDGDSGSVAYSNTVTGNDDGILVQQSSSSYCNSIQIVNNTVQHNYAYAGIFVMSSNGVEVVGNNVSKNTTLNGIALNGSSNDQVNGNGVYNNVNADGIYDFQGTNNIIAGNNAYSNGNNGINIDTTTGDLLIFNATWNNSYNGIQITGGSKNSIWLGNSSVSNQDGILLINTTGNAVIGNILSLNGGNGLQLKNAQDTSIAFNSTHGNAGAPISIDSQSVGTVETYKNTGSSFGRGEQHWENGWGNSFCFSDYDSDDYDYFRGFCN